MKKYLLFVLALALFMGVCYDVDATVLQPAYDYTITVDGHNPVDKPPMFIKRVRYAKITANEIALVSGNVVAWDTNSADGVTVSLYIVSASGPQPGIAGVLVTPLQTQDTGAADLTDDNYGYMCVGGWCLASIDTSTATAGNVLVPPTESGAHGRFATNELAPSNSQDCGVLLTDVGTDSNAPVYLHLQ